MQVGPTHLMDRRRFLRSAGAGFVASLSPQSLHAASSDDVIFASAYKASDGSFGIATLTEQGEVLHRYTLPNRGHDIVSNPAGNQLVAFARRPGTFAAIIDPSHRRPPRLISSANGRHFYGHGVFSADGKFLFATENDFENTRGAIGVYDATDGFQRIAEYDAYGIGPHDMDLLPDNKTLVIANGGIETHPDFPRVKLNIATMAPNLSFIDLETGQLKAQFKLPADSHKLSIRHLTVLGEEVWFACQNEGDAADAQSLVGSVSLANGDFDMLELPMTINASLRGYVGSIASNSRTNQIAITSPVGGVGYKIDVATNKIAQMTSFDGVCGVAELRRDFIASTGAGVFNKVETAEVWDNHLANIV